MLFNGKQCEFIKTPYFIMEAVDFLSDPDGKYEMELLQRGVRELTADAVYGILRNATEYRSAVRRDAGSILDTGKNLLHYFEGFDSIFAMRTLRRRGRNPLTRDEIDLILWNDIYLSSGEFDEDEHRPEQGDIGAMFAHIFARGISDELKLRLVGMYNERYELIPRLVELLWSIADICEKHFSIVERDFNRAIERCEAIDDMSSLIASYGSVTAVVPEVYISILSHSSLMLSVHAQDEVNGVFRYGMYVGEYPEKQTGVKEKNALAIMKTLAEPTRWQILTLLKNNRMGQKAIADAVGLTPSTVSHHLDSLIQEQMVRVDIPAGSRRILYTFNGQKIVELAEFLKNFGGGQ